MSALRFLLLLLCFIIQRAATSDANNYFIKPSSGNGINPVWTLGDDQVISWKTTLGVFNVSIWQQSLVQQSAASQGNIYSKIHPTDSVTNFTWPVQLYGFDLAYSNVFFLWIDPDEAGGFVSCYFNITRAEGAESVRESATTVSGLGSATGSALTRGRVGWRLGLVSGLGSRCLGRWLRWGFWWGDGGGTCKYRVVVVVREGRRGRRRVRLLRLLVVGLGMGMSMGLGMGLGVDMDTSITEVGRGRRKWSGRSRGTD
ncbi:hypothetical protein ASPACDRAFT_41260 [Aspergillus aculeatus ATCC 16872]|uniref:Uncharacterized protein n=1 Tax=Aspergillus aculeatus (strain ATCC 16872 / CBS 172.66 / WB 5094) TaxID=690307 RepID=A0A1L9X1Q2_ASPA1|nr:uncharacterized protein ASPACDRAFT_41260 [Aspergillus aculeatus ATCC 16872]OJK02432.1 hypothetical protein ASPACDRAFT_41260 [Aspergillus aculeatus ATCC 16872]